MKIPYNRLHVHRDIVFAARGGKIHTFSLQDGRHISTWQHPDVEKVAKAIESNAKAEAEAAEKEHALAAHQVAGPTPEEDEPPAKKQKLASGAESEVQPEEPENDAAKPKSNGKKDKKKGKQGGENKRTVSRVPDRPVITHLTSDAEGKSLVAVTGHDKNIWVFDHDGEGNITQFSQRTMPKRPSAVVVGPDSQIICADKFGDVYALPLRGTTSVGPRVGTPQSTSSAPIKPAASALTVHSKRNLRALSEQQKRIELASRSKGDASDTKSDEPNFELTLLLGHVSMLTAMALAEAEGRRYIVTADRDEHIRVSRYLPQAYVIEGFCLGHKNFVSDMTIPVGKGQLLVSGGGDEELHVWDWKSGQLLSKTNVLSLAKEIAPETSKVAIVGLNSLVFPSEDGDVCYVLAICEGINAIFSWQVTDENTLNHPGIIQLPGKPLHLTIATAEGAPPKILTAVDPGAEGKAKSLHVFTLLQNEGRIAVDQDVTVHDTTLEAGEMEVPEAEVQSLLYNTESLRKQSAEADETGEAVEPVEEAQEDSSVMEE
ncbi:hypothetical protein B0I35DRAFT_473939 [Stachybotrys elegans]|uniref:Transfer RNA methyltransferase 82 n=1 Tax=Stachybotrys elegans TaxID=80388 RepID=A0A8K0WYA6_9HYPO|nr:hypothetical protein B0I35DRAFT_473939 [Stachybotrys elegans]